jgi:large subunit ribosomal protein L20
MSRVKRGVVVHRRHKKLLKQAKGFWGQRKNIYRRAHETLMRAWAFAFKGRKLKKRDMRSLFIVRVKAAANQHSVSYSKFIHLLKKSEIDLNRKMLSQLAIFEPAAFTYILSVAQK